MNDYISLTKKYSKITIIVIIVSLLAAMAGLYSVFLQGFVLGAVISLISLLSTYFQVKRVGNVAATEQFKFILGTGSRVFLVVIALSFVVQWPNYFDLIGFIVGLMFTYALLLLDPIRNIIFSFSK